MGIKPNISYSVRKEIADKILKSKFEVARAQIQFLIKTISKYYVYIYVYSHSRQPRKSCYMLPVDVATK
jgi:hypothetical protein